MLEILYRIYEVPSEEERQRNKDLNLDCSFYMSTSQSENNELLMDVMICDDRESFKNIIRDMYGSNIVFRYSKKLKAGDVYCVIIGEHAYDIEKYLTKVSYKCSCCDNDVQTVGGYDIRFSKYDLTDELFSNEEYVNMRFCSKNCRTTMATRLKQLHSVESELESWINKDMFEVNGVIGYIYKITKKSTGEFYIGQTKYVPIFRWGQHLRTSRFDISNILDYQFETLCIVKSDQNILEIEEQFIKNYREQFKGLCINIVHNK